MSENTEQDKENTDTTDNEDKKKYPNVYVSIAIASIIIASPFIIYNYFFKSSTPISIEMPKMPEMPNMPNPFATTEIESKLTSIQDAMTKMENKMDEVDKKVTDLSTKPEPSSSAPTPTPEDNGGNGGIFGNIGNMFGTAAPAPIPAPIPDPIPAPIPDPIPAPIEEDTSATTSTPVKEEKESSVFDIFSSTDAVTQPPAPIPPAPIPANPIPANPIVAEIPQINNELNEKVNIENPFNESNDPDLKITPSIGEEPINQPTAPPQFGQPIGGKTRKRRKYKKRKSKKVNLPIVV